MVNYTAFHVLVLSSYSLLVASMILSKDNVRENSEYYFIFYLVTNMFNHLAYFGKIDTYPEEELRGFFPKNKCLKWIVIILLLIPISFPEVAVIKVISMFIFMLEKH